MYLARFAVIGGVAVAIACGGSTPSAPGGEALPPPPPGAVVDVTIQDFSFSPVASAIKVGTTVRWTNNGPSPHTSTSDAGVWGSATLGPPGGGGYGGGGGSAGESFQLTFTQPGTYTYHCAIHPPASYPGFTGTVTVNP